MLEDKTQNNTLPLAAAAVASAASTEDDEESATESESLSSGSGHVKNDLKLKTSEDQQDTSATEDKKYCVVDEKKTDEMNPSSVLQKGTIAAGINSTQEDSAVSVYGSGGDLIKDSPQPLQLQRGSIVVPGPTYHGEIRKGHDEKEIQKKDKGSLLEADPSSRVTPNPSLNLSETRARDRIQALINNAVSLKDSAVVSDVEYGDEGEGETVHNCLVQSNNVLEDDNREDKSHNPNPTWFPDSNTNAAQTQTSAVLNYGDNQQNVLPGILFVPGPGYDGTGTHTGYVSASDDDDDINEGCVIIQGFLPEDEPSRSQQRKSSAERKRERIQSLIDNAVTLDDSAVLPIPIEEDGVKEGNNDLEAARSRNAEVDDKEVKTSICLWFLPLLVLACIILAIVLPLSLRGKSGNSAQDTTSLLSDAVCLPGGVDVRFELAKSILSNITSPDVLEDESTPQGKAIRWIVCDDSISVQLLGNQDPSTGKLPKQDSKNLPSGLSGEVQVTRRYILATFYFATSQDSPWTDSLNFLSPDLHECNWHVNYTRQNFPYGGKLVFFRLEWLCCHFAAIAYACSLTSFYTCRL
jgi:hypothetical protein